ncbi:TIGR03032 family protein [Novipirellula artificiosorum]|nr:TIGR03032 family protein [Novipirellula artificiosorum]
MIRHNPPTTIGELAIQPLQGIDESNAAASSALRLTSSQFFTDWLAELRVSLAFTTYQAGKLFLVGHTPAGRLSGFERTFPRSMGLWTNGQTMWLSSLYQLWRLENMIDPQDAIEKYDRVFVPQVGYTTGDIDIHDIAMDGGGRVVFVNTLFSCLATVSERFSFEPVWKPQFINHLAGEDRCHLNGLAMRDGKPRYVTLCGLSDVAGGWRETRLGGGHVIDIVSDESVCQSLTMPHSPRWHDDRLWLLDSGTGYLGYVDVQSGSFERVAFCPGYARGLAIVGNWAVVGLSRPRKDTFVGLPLDGELAKRNVNAKCGLRIINLRTGVADHWLHIDGAISELYDVAAINKSMRPSAMGFKTNDIRHNVWFKDGIGNSTWSCSESDRG